MEYRNFGRTGVKVSPLCLGCMNFSWKTSKEEALKIIDRAIAAGINFLDTANIYHLGKSEEAVGAALKKNGKRDRIFLATKVHGRMDETDPNAMGNSRRHIMMQCEASLKRLQTDWIDLYQIHRPCSDTPIDETLKVLDDLIRQGKVRYIGTSTFAAWQLVEAQMVSREHKLNRFISEQPPYNLLERRIERELIPMAITYDIALIPWSPLAGGFLTGKYRRGQQRPENSRFTDRNNPWVDLNFTDASFDILEAAEAIAKEKGCSISQLSLNWCMNQPGITSPIIGPRTLEQLEDNLKAIDIVLSGEDKKRLDEAAKPATASADYYQADFGPHRFRV